MLTVGQLNLRY